MITHQSSPLEKFSFSNLRATPPANKLLKTATKHAGTRLKASFLPLLGLGQSANTSTSSNVDLGTGKASFSYFYLVLVVDFVLLLTLPREWSFLGLKIPIVEVYILGLRHLRQVAMGVLMLPRVLLLFSCLMQTLFTICCRFCY